MISFRSRYRPVTVPLPSRYSYSVPWLTVGHRYTPLPYRPTPLHNRYITVPHRPSPSLTVPHRYLPLLTVTYCYSPLREKFFITNEMKYTVIENINNLQNKFYFY